MLKHLYLNHLKLVKDLINQKFGLLTVLRETGERKSNRVVWECQCECGNLIKVSSDSLVRGYRLSCGCLKESYGIKQIKELLTSNNFNFTTWDDFGTELNNAIYKYDYTVANELVKLFNLHNSLFIDCEKNSSLDGMIFCITGSLSHFVNREAMKEQIEKLGGKVTGSVSKKTTALINNDSESESSKNVSAKKLSIPIITEEEFIKKYGVSAE